MINDFDDLFFHLHEDAGRVVEVEVPVALLLKLAEYRGRILAMRDYAKVHKNNIGAKELSILGGFALKEDEKDADL